MRSLWAKLLMYNNMNVNKAILVGRITNDLELKTTKTGKEVLAFSIATNETWVTDGEKKEKTTFHNIVVWGKQAQTVQTYFVKGQEIYVEGRISTRSWDDEKTGQKVYRTEIIMDKFEFGPKPAQKQIHDPNPGKASDTGVDYPNEEINPEDIPF